MANVKSSSKFYYMCLFLMYMICFNITINCQDKPYNNTVCVTYENLRAENHAVIYEDINYYLAFPENYCYGSLRYNITKDAYDRIVELNLKAYSKYRDFLNLYYFIQTSDSAKPQMNTGCLAQFRHIACYTTFNACEEVNNNGVIEYKENNVCHFFCEQLRIRCDEYFPASICVNNSTEKYCGGVNYSIRIKINYILLIATFLLIFF